MTVKYTLKTLTTFFGCQNLKQSPGQLRWSATDIEWEVEGSNVSVPWW